MQDALTIFEEIRPRIIHWSDAERLRLIRSIAGLAAEALPVAALPDSQWVEPGNGAKAGDEPVDQTVAQLLVEQEAWYRRPPAERQPYQHEFVALYGGEVIDHDAQRLVLLRRVRQKFGKAAIAILPALQDCVPEYVILR